MSSKIDPKQFSKTIQTKSGNVEIKHLPKLTEGGFGDISNLPFSIKVLLESALRNCDEYQITSEDVLKLVRWSPETAGKVEVAFKPARVVLQDFTGVPAVVDLAAMRSAIQRLGGKIEKINPQVPCDLVIDHSVQVDAFGSENALSENVNKEFSRNIERYEFLKWGQNAFDNFRVVPPATGIVHQVNLEYLAQGVLTKEVEGKVVAFPDSLVGTDSHTTMINGIGILGWGVGGIEAEAVMLGEPINMLMPEVVGLKLTGKLKEGVTATDLVLTITQVLRQKGVVGKFVEYFGEGLEFMNLPDRATLANMAPEYGATMGYFPVDQRTLEYYELTGRPKELIDLIEVYSKEQGMFYDPKGKDPQFSDVVEVDLSSIEPSLAGPKRPQDKVFLKDMNSAFQGTLKAPVNERGFALSGSDLERKGEMLNGSNEVLSHGAVTIAAITSCTNTSNPSVMVGAGILAKKAVEKGLKVKPYVKTSLAPGSKVVTEYLSSGNLLGPLEKLGFHVVGYGCTTCIGNSGPLPEKVAKVVQDNDLVVASVLSGNRNFEGRVNPLVKANYLASPSLVVAFAIAGTVDIDLTNDPIGKDQDGNDVYLKDIWPTQEEVNSCMKETVTREAFTSQYQDVFKGSEEWQKVSSTSSSLYGWKENSTYIQEPPFFLDLKKEGNEIKPIEDARVLVMLGDSVTTDHISPAGAIGPKSPAGEYLSGLSVDPKDFNSYGSRRGNDRIMTRGTFANIRLRNLLVPGSEGSWTKHFPSNEEMSIYDASLKYREENQALIVLAGKEYGTGSSRDWAAKGTKLLGVSAVIAESFERIHRSNLVGMGVLPLQFAEGSSTESLGLKGDETFSIPELSDSIKPRQEIEVVAKSAEGEKRFKCLLRIDTPVEVDYYRNGGILQTVLMKLSKD